MRIISRKKLKDYWETYTGTDQPAMESALKAWVQEAKKASWQTASELKAQYCSASILKGGRVVFNVCGNKFRLIVAINYPYSVLYVRWIGTHEDYDSVSAEEV